MNVQHLQGLLQQSALNVGNLRGVFIKAVASPSDADEGITVAVTISTDKADSPKFPYDFHLGAAELSRSETQIQNSLERSLETGANEFNAQYGKGAYDAGLLWKRR